MKKEYVYKYFQLATGRWFYTENYAVAVALSTADGKYIGRKIEKYLITKINKK